jgi:hypothetical protein
MTVQKLISLLQKQNQEAKVSLVVWDSERQVEKSPMKVWKVKNRKSEVVVEGYSARDETKTA